MRGGGAVASGISGLDGASACGRFSAPIVVSSTAPASVGTIVRPARPGNPLLAAAPAWMGGGVPGCEPLTDDSEDSVSGTDGAGGSMRARLACDELPPALPRLRLDMVAQPQQARRASPRQALQGPQTCSGRLCEVGRALKSHSKMRVECSPRSIRSCGALWPIEHCVQAAGHAATKARSLPTEPGIRALLVPERGLARAGLTRHNAHPPAHAALLLPTSESRQIASSIADFRLG